MTEPEVDIPPTRNLTDMNPCKTTRISTLLTVFAFFSILLLPPSLWAAARTASVTGNWSSTAT